MAGGKVTLGADASVAAGPVGRTAAATTDTTLNAQVLSYSRSEGIFAGVALDGTVLAIDDGANEAAYGVSGILPSQILEGKVGTRASGRRRLHGRADQGDGCERPLQRSRGSPRQRRLAAGASAPRHSRPGTQQLRNRQRRSRWKTRTREHRRPSEPARSRRRCSAPVRRRRRPGRTRRYRRGRNSRPGSSPGTAGDSPRRSRTPAPRDLRRDAAVTRARAVSRRNAAALRSAAARCASSYQ